MFEPYAPQSGYKEVNKTWRGFYQSNTPSPEEKEILYIGATKHRNNSVHYAFLPFQNTFLYHFCH